jgi:hypothetical protein
VVAFDKQDGFGARRGQQDEIGLFDGVILLNEREHSCRF